MKKNILMLITEVSLGGAEKVFFQHYQEFSKIHNVIVCVFSKKNFFADFQFDSIIFELDDTPIKNAVTRWWSRRAKLEKIISVENIDICISHMEGPNFLNASTNSTCKKIFVSHGSITVNPQKSWINKFISKRVLIPFLYNHADKVITISEAMLKEHIDVGVRQKKMLQISNYFDLEKIQSVQNEPTIMDAIFNKYKTLLNVGRLANQKNQDFLLEAFNEIRKDTSVKLILVGDGELKSKLIEKCEFLSLKIYDASATKVIDETADVFFMGAENNPYKYMAKASVFMLTSFNEGFPLVLGEAMACGLPIIASDCPTGPREMLSSPSNIFQGKISGFVRLFTGNLISYFSENDHRKNLANWKAAFDDMFNDTVRYNELKSNCIIKSREYSKENILPKWIDAINGIL